MTDLVSNLDNRARSTAIAQVIVEELLARAMGSDDEYLDDPKVASKSRVCHQCHAPLDESIHGGVPCGVGRCTLDHWRGCKGGIEGGIDGKGKSWASCKEDSDEDTVSDTGSESEKKEQLLPKTVAGAAAMLHKATLGEDSSVLIESSSESEDEELREQRLEIERFKKQMEAQSLQAAAKVARRGERQKKRDKEKLDLAQQLKKLKDEQAALSASLPPSSTAAASSGTKTKIIKDKVAEHEAKKQRKAAAKKAEEQLKKSGAEFSMPGIRALPGVRAEVEGYITQLKAMIPTLSSDPTASGFSSSTFQPAGVLQAGDRAPEKKYIYVTELGRAVPVVDSVGDLPATHKGSEI